MLGTGSAFRHPRHRLTWEPIAPGCTGPLTFMRHDAADFWQVWLPTPTSPIRSRSPMRAPTVDGLCGLLAARSWRSTPTDAKPIRAATRQPTTRHDERGRLGVKNLRARTATAKARLVLGRGTDRLPSHPALRSLLQHGASRPRTRNGSPRRRAPPGYHRPAQVA
jgi:hypothetical protein